MILAALEAVVPDPAAEVEISIAVGEKLAERTLNDRLGTTGLAARVVAASAVAEAFALAEAGGHPPGDAIAPPPGWWRRRRWPPRPCLIAP